MMLCLNVHDLTGLRYPQIEHGTYIELLKWF